MEAVSISAEPALNVHESAGADRYDLVVLNSTGTRVLLLQGNWEHTLPTISIPQFSRPAEKITSLLLKVWNIKAVLLWSGLADAEQCTEYFAVLEIVEHYELGGSGLEWFVIEEAVARVAVAQASLIRQSHAKALTICLGFDAEPFSRLGWLHRLESWIKEVVRPIGMQLGGFSQFNGSASFSLIRFETDSKSLWFKAVGAPNLCEYPITLLLSRLFPDYLPRILASDPLLNGWLMESGGESTLYYSPEPGKWMNAARRLAELQSQSLGCTPELLQAGCRDLRFETLTLLVPAFFDAMAELMARQTKPSPAPLTVDELMDLARSVREALSTMGDLGEISTLGHADFNPGNILIDGEQSVFTDWAEAYVGTPLLTFEYLLAHLNRSFPSLMEQEDRLREAYARPWLSLISAQTLRFAFDLSPLIAVYAYAASSNAWNDAQRLADPRVQGSLRSLTRRMKREADLVLERRDGHASFAPRQSNGVRK